MSTLWAVSRRLQLFCYFEVVPFDLVRTSVRFVGMLTVPKLENLFQKSPLSAPRVANSRAPQRTLALLAGAAQCFGFPREPEQPTLSLPVPAYLSNRAMYCAAYPVCINWVWFPIRSLISTSVKSLCNNAPGSIVWHARRRWKGRTHAKGRSGE